MAFRVINSLVPDPVDNAVDFRESVPDVAAFSLMAKGILEFADAYPHYFHWWWLAPSHVRPIQLVALVYHVGGDEAYGVSLPLFAGFVDGVIPSDIGPSFDMVLVRHRVTSTFLDCAPRRFKCGVCVYFRPTSRVLGSFDKRKGEAQVGVALSVDRLHGRHLYAVAMPTAAWCDTHYDWCYFLCVPRAGDVDLAGIYVGPYPRVKLGIFLGCRFLSLALVTRFFVVSVVHVASVTDPVAYADAPVPCLPLAVLGGDNKAFGGVRARSKLLSKLLWVRHLRPVRWSKLVLNL